MLDCDAYPVLLPELTDPVHSRRDQPRMNRRRIHPPVERLLRNGLSTHRITDTRLQEPISQEVLRLIRSTATR